MITANVRELEASLLLMGFTKQKGRKNAGSATYKLRSGNDWLTVYINYARSRTVRVQMYPSGSPTRSAWFSVYDVIPIVARMIEGEEHI